MNKIVLCKDLRTAEELQSQGCKLINFEDFKDRIVLTNRLNF